MMTNKNSKTEKIWAKTQIENFEKIRPRFDEYAGILEKVLSKNLAPKIINFRDFSFS